MRRTFFAVVSLAAILSSCSKELIEVDSNRTDEQINFHAYLQRSSNKQANSDSDIDRLQLDGFNVYAYNTVTTNWNNGVKNSYSPIFNQKLVTYSNGVWSYSPPVLWPNDDKVSFFAYSPLVEFVHFARSAEGDPIIYFFQKQERIDQYDLLVAYMLDKTKASVNSEGKLGFSMKHALARVGFKAKYIDSPNIASVEVSNIIIKYSADILTRAIFKFTGANSLDAGANPWITGISSGISAQEVITGPIAIGKDGFDYILDSIDGSTVFNTGNSRNFILLVPQNITPGMITISMKIAANRMDGTTETWTITDRDLFDALSNRNSTSLQMGKAYDFTFNFNVDHSTVDPNDPTTPMDPANVLMRFDVTEIAGWDVSPGDLSVAN